MSQGEIAGHPAPLLEVRDLSVRFRTADGDVTAVSDMTYSVGRGETVAMIGESGCGKSTAARAILRLFSTENVAIAGSAVINGVDLVTAPERVLRGIRGDRIAVVMQDALSALNPMYAVGHQIAEVFRRNRGYSRAESMDRAVAWLDRVGIPSPKHRAKDYPHRFSGGMRQRIVIAMALALEPELLIADEPTTALDATVQAEILDELKQLQDELGMAMILITHNLSVARDVSDRALVVYAGRIIEEARTDTILSSPRHPYTIALMESLPRWDHKVARLASIGGAPPPLSRNIEGCAFAPRCWMARPRCFEHRPELLPVAANHVSACHYADEASIEARARVTERV